MDEFDYLEQIPCAVGQHL